jgi:hypothetical protein
MIFLVGRATYTYKVFPLEPNLFFLQKFADEIMT